MQSLMNGKSFLTNPMVPILNWLIHAGDSNMLDTILSNDPGKYNEPYPVSINSLSEIGQGICATAVLLVSFRPGVTGQVWICPGILSSSVSKHVNPNSR